MSFGVRIDEVRKKFSWVMRFSKDGKLVDKVLHKGQGPREINMDIQEYCFADSSLYILDSGLGITRYTSNYERKERLQIDCDRNREEVSPDFVTQKKSIL